MNTVLNLADSTIQYFRGRSTGAIGLFSIVLAILIYAFWDVISPVFEYIHLTSFLKEIGLIEDGGGALNAYKILVALFISILAIQVVGIILLVLFSVISNIISIPVMEKFFAGLIIVLLLPFGILYALFFSKKSSPKKIG
ncbi:hypothetical protein [Bacillus swezeyi]|uniref:Uncharacterized protein n=1 Tax=Bacillus swezeyi TaxID=1925020 RepID=A0A5M8RM24_9BACI|nr:hypothetical protein [Bacillus swezeyi]KAA6446982.1 hypothetical protein DX927_23340 [Bacillus swezeyi]KAA6471550.1 hypothetical protein DX928_23580 [Bacillus swezeyi]